MLVAPSRRIQLSDPVNPAWVVILLYVAFLASGLLARKWPVDTDGHPVIIDYLSMWAAGRLALAGHAAAAYDWTAHKAIEVTAVGHDFATYASWFYPPAFFFATAPFALLPFAPSLLAWNTVGLGLALIAVGKVIPRRAPLILAAIATPVVLWNATLGQNGCLSAALIAGALALVERRPVIAGALIACLTFKPQLGILLPVALVCGGYWRTFMTAAVGTALLVVASLAVFGADAWAAFLGSIGLAKQTILVDTAIGAAKLESAFGLMRLLGGSTDIAWTAQLLVATPVVALVGWLWRSSAPLDLKAAALAAGTALVTPYVLIYDLVILVVPIAFLARSGLSKAETLAVAAAGILLFARALTDVPLGLAASVIVGGVVLVRILRSGPLAITIRPQQRHDLRLLGLRRGRTGATAAGGLHGKAERG